VTSRPETLALVVTTWFRDLMVTDRDQRAASTSRGQDERAAATVSMRPDLVLGASSRISATSNTPGSLDAISAIPGDTSYLRCGGCGATIALDQHARYDGQSVDYVPHSYECCDTPLLFGNTWRTNG
jgi:hypothetical protein